MFLRCAPYVAALRREMLLRCSWFDRLTTNGELVAAELRGVALGDGFLRGALALAQLRADYA